MNSTTHPTLDSPQQGPDERHEGWSPKWMSGGWAVGGMQAFPQFWACIIEAGPSMQNKWLRNRRRLQKFCRAAIVVAWWVASRYFVKTLAVKLIYGNYWAIGVKSRSLRRREVRRQELSGSLKPRSTYVECTVWCLHSRVSSLYQVALTKNFAQFFVIVTWIAWLKKYMPNGQR